GDLRIALRLKMLGECRVLLKKYAEAQGPLQDSLAIYLKKQPKDILRHMTAILLGAALLGQKKYADAEPLLLHGAKELVAQAANLSPANRQLALAVVQRIAELYETAQQPEQAEGWRQRLQVLQAKEER